MDDHDSNKLEYIRHQGIMLAPYEVAQIFMNRFPIYGYLQHLHSKRGEDDNDHFEEASKPVVLSKKLNKYADYRRISGKRNGPAAPVDATAGKGCNHSANCKTSLEEHSRLSLILKEDAKRNEYSDYRRIAGKRDVHSEYIKIAGNPDVYSEYRKRNIYSDYRRIAGKRSATTMDAPTAENIKSIDQDLPVYNIVGQNPDVKESDRIINDEDWTVKFTS